MVLADECLGRVERHDAPVDHDGHAVAQGGLVHIVGGDKHGGAGSGGAAYHAPELTTREGVDTARRLIEEDDLGGMQVGHGEGQLLSPSGRDAAHEVVAMMPELELGEHGLGLGEYLLAVHAVDASVELHIFQHGEVLVEGELLTHVADVALDVFALCHDVAPGHAARARGGTAQSAEDAYGSGLAGAIGSEEAEDLALCHIERYVVDRTESTELLGEVPNRYDVFHTPPGLV